ncbi:MAG: serine/threonine-protein kinase [Gaiellales bacterium]
MSELGGRYRLEASIGRGGTGEVFRARDLRLDRVVAVKLLHPWVAEDADARKRFRREATTLAQLRHPNVVQVLDFDDALPAPYLVQEHCGGGTLVRRTQEAPLPWPEVAEIGLAIARGLAHAHAAGVTHRDLKPGNVLVGDDGQLRVADFGLADVLRRDATELTLTGDGTRVGSPEYWAPEQAAGIDVTERADMYALGCILYELATGSLPFEGSDRVEVGMRRMHEDPPPPTAFVPDLPAEAEALILALLQRAPERRPRAEDVARMLAGDVPIIPDADQRETTRIEVEDIPPTMLAPEPEPARPGVRTGVLRFGAVVLALGVLLAGLGVAAGTTLSRAGIEVDRPIGRTAAAAGLGVAVGAALICFALAVLALWATRNRHRAELRTVRSLLGVLAVILAGLASGTIVWTANAWITVGVSILWGKLQ